MMEIVTADGGSQQLLERVGSARPSEDVEGVGATFEALFRQRYCDVYRYSLLMLRSAADAEDVAGETFRRAYEAWCSDRGPTGQALPWLLLIARRLIIDKARRRKLLSWIPLGSLNPSAEPVAQADTGRTEFWLWFDRFARELSIRQREVLILRYQRDLEDAQIAEILGISSSAVRSLVARACATLRRNPEIWR